VGVRSPSSSPMFDNKKYQKNWYQSNKDNLKKRAISRRAEVSKENRENLIAYLREHPCVDCGEKDIIVLQFDHVRGTKRRDISYMICAGFRWDTILKEIEKCDVRCANDHLRKTAKQQSHFNFLNL
jgi:hypothetical protein